MNPAENYILNQQEPFRSILMHLQAVIEHTVLDLDLKYKYRVPFYYCEGKPFCYLNVSEKKNYVDVGFWRAAHLTKHVAHMVSEKRKVIKTLRYTSLEKIDDHILIEILKEAYSVRGGKFYK